MSNYLPPGLTIGRILTAAKRSAGAAPQKVTIYDERWLKVGVAEDLRARARLGLNNGRAASQSYLEYCRGFQPSTGTLLIFTRDAGHHASGWWKNPDYERCWHLSLSFHDPETAESAPKDKRLTEEWLNVFFGEEKRKLWCEPPYSEEGKQRDVWHYRLFCDEHWRSIVPRGEVYTRELTEAGWKSYSEVQAQESALRSDK